MMVLVLAGWLSRDYLTFGLWGLSSLMVGVLIGIVFLNAVSTEHNASTSSPCSCSSASSPLVSCLCVCD